MMRFESTQVLVAAALCVISGTVSAVPTSGDVFAVNVADGWALSGNKTESVCVASKTFLAVSGADASIKMVWPKHEDIDVNIFHPNVQRRADTLFTTFQFEDVHSEELPTRVGTGSLQMEFYSPGGIRLLLGGMRDDQIISVIFPNDLGRIEFPVSAIRQTWTEFEECRAWL